MPITMNVPTDAGLSSVGGGTLQRPRYFPRQLITPEEMNLEATYFRDRMRRHNRLLHGWGVVCGAAVCPVPRTASDGAWYDVQPLSEHKASYDECAPCDGWEPWKVVVTPGYILGPYGDEIVIAAPVTVDLRRRCTPGLSGADSCRSPDPWCSDVTAPGADSPLFVAVRYEEVMSRPVRIPAAGCGCEDLECDYSRWCDGLRDLHADGVPRVP